MRQAKSLRDLLSIRNANRDYLGAIGGNLGTALGFKKRFREEVSDEPAILVFVPRKIEAKWLPKGHAIKKRLAGPGDRWCPLGVCRGKALLAGSREA
ncbi:MAG: hypothetical protein HY744_15575 [Deltaproteobacteria bacterium]|nr:hypothetical protein [Deltaproteobacteria bacterium]